MTLQALLKTKDPELKIKIGAADGTGWFYCGTVEDYLDNYGRYDLEVLEYTFDRKKKAQEARDSLIRAGFNPVKYVKRELQFNRLSFTLDGYMASLAEWLHTVEIKSKTYAAACDAYDNYRSLHTRPVMSAENAEETNCIRVIVPGTEHGGYWETQDGTGIAFEPRGKDKGT